MATTNDCSKSAMGNSPRSTLNPEADVMSKNALNSNLLNMVALLKPYSGIINLFSHIDHRQIEVVKSDRGRNTFQIDGNLPGNLPQHILKWTETDEVIIVKSVQHCRFLRISERDKPVVAVPTTKARGMRATVKTFMDWLRNEPRVAESTGIEISKVICIKDTPYISIWKLFKKAKARTKASSVDSEIADETSEASQVIQEIAGMVHTEEE
ncbi:hypothetical protein BGZ63DRAFT_399300 [Mariannaea sp. PMI_226]|nr:hypothetical protein BGZ63DRAFT_399300 [Mariannaea sp. PMI_226]